MLRYSQSMKAHRSHKKASKIPRNRAESFESSEFLHHPKNHFWYLGISLLLLALLLLTLQSGDYLLSTVIVVAAVAIFRLSGLRPSTRKVEISHRGIYWGERFFGFHQLKSFWISEVGGEIRIYFDQINFRPTLSFELPRTRLKQALSSLADQLPYHPHKAEPLADRFGRWLRL